MMPWLVKLPFKLGERLCVVYGSAPVDIDLMHQAPWIKICTQQATAILPHLISMRIGSSTSKRSKASSISSTSGVRSDLRFD